MLWDGVRQLTNTTSIYVNFLSLVHFNCLQWKHMVPQCCIHLKKPVSPAENNVKLNLGVSGNFGNAIPFYQ